MPSAIGLRIYQISIRQKGNSKPIVLESDELETSTQNFIADYIRKHSKITQSAELERSWYFEVRENDNLSSCRGYVHYGTFGFESNFVDGKTKARNYRRKTTDVEEIPLYFEFWCPPRENFGFVGFQSFQGRSCINLVMSGLKQAFENENSDFTFVYKKLLPSDANGSILAKAPVKRLRLIRKDAPSDLADRYFRNPSQDSIDFEIIVSARRRKSLGSMSSLLKSIKTTKGVIMDDGVDFNEAVAEIQIGNKTRRVGILGANGDAGVIDLTNEVDRGPDGHPTFKSLKKATNEILDDFYETIKGDRG